MLAWVNLADVVVLMEFITQAIQNLYEQWHRNLLLPLQKQETSIKSFQGEPNPPKNEKEGKPAHT